MTEKVFDSNWKKTMTVLERDALTIARRIVGSIKTDLIFNYVSTEACLMSGNTVNYLYCFPINSGNLSNSQKEIWASALLSEAAKRSRKKKDTKNTKRVPSGSVIWHGWGIISPTGLVLEAIRERSKHIVKRLDSLHKDSKLVKVEAVLIPATRRLKIK